MPKSQCAAFVPAALMILLFTTIPVPLRAAAAAAAAADEPLGDFEAHADVGKVDPPGSAQFDKVKHQYQLTASGENIWSTHDDFHFVYRKAANDFVLSAAVAFQGEGKNAHRKTGLMLRQGLEPDAPYADVVVHGDGLISLQYRETAGGATKEIKSQVKSPAATVRLERHGETITASVARLAEKPGAVAPTFEPIGSIKLALKDPAYVGLVVCSHDPKVRETAVVSGVSFTTPP